MTPSDERVPTSQLFQTVLSRAPIQVTPAWVLTSLHQRSFGMVMLILGLIAMVPGVSILTGLLLMALSFQMIMARDAPILPRFLALRTLPTNRVARLVDRSVPAIRALEKFIRPRWQTPLTATKRVVGFVMFLMAATLLMPIPFSNVIPGALTMVVAIAYLEEDGVLLCIALAGSLASLVITALEVWAALRGADFLLRL